MNKIFAFLSLLVINFQGNVDSYLENHKVVQKSVDLISVKIILKMRNKDTLFHFVRANNKKHAFIQNKF